MNIKNIAALALALCLTGCSLQDDHAPNSPGNEPHLSSSTHAALATGPAVAQALRQRYADKRENCGKDSMPAFLWSGIILRGTVASTSYDSWNPSPTAVRVGGVSFSFLRADYNMKRLANNYTNGFMLTPILSTPREKYKMAILCFFPIDGTSNSRTDAGCGTNTRYPKDSAPCNDQGIFTAEGWRDHFNRRPSDYDWRCSFDVRDALNAVAGRNFYQGILGGRLVAQKAFEIPNDLKIEVWPQNIPEQLPIEAFFYISQAGLSGAQHDQQRFYSLTHIAVPIISVKLATSVNGTATFEYVASDQVVTIP
ncbi:halovibrin HvnA [Pseudomonas sp. NPDC087358]|uniref:halovibrin HvnA n=1 Tax=Pseudomonas sp. NPDC087358 TaxID=3364439 RepID=UPI003850E73E